MTLPKNLRYRLEYAGFRLIQAATVALQSAVLVGTVDLNHERFEPSGA